MAYPELEPLTGRLVALTRDLMLIPGCALRPDDRERCYEFVRNHVESLDHVNIRTYRMDGIPSLVVLPDRIEEPEILLCGHLDVIDHPDARVYRSHVSDTRIYGPGAGDMKGALAILLELFRDIHTRFPRASLGLLVTADEEVGGQSGVRYMFEDIGLRCGHALLPDGGSLSEITIEEKGMLHLRVRAEGHATHAARPWLGRNPLDLLMDRLTILRAAVAGLSSGPGGDAHWRPTCAVTVIETPNRTANRVPAVASATVDVRFPSPYSLAAMRDTATAALGPDVDVATLLTAEPLALSVDPLFVEVTEAVTGQRPALVREHGGSDARFIGPLGIPVMMSRPLVGDLHAEDEWIEIASMTTFYRIYESYVLRKLALTGA